MTIFSYCSFISTERIRPTHNWLCLHKQQIGIDFLSSFQKTRMLWHKKIRLPFSKVGRPECILGKQECSDVLDCPCFSQDRKRHGSKCSCSRRKCRIKPSTSPAIFPDWFQRPISLPRVLMGSLTAPGAGVQCHGVSFISPCPWRRGRQKVCRSSAAEDSGSQVLWYYLRSEVKKQRFSLCLTLSFNSHFGPCGNWEVAADQLLANSFIDLPNETSALSRLFRQLVATEMLSR